MLLATIGRDYSGLPKVLSFSPGQLLNMPSCAEINITDDDTLENTEIFSIALSTDFPQGVTLSRDRSVVEIIDNEEGKHYANLQPLPAPMTDWSTFQEEGGGTIREWLKSRGLGTTRG